MASFLIIFAPKVGRMRLLLLFSLPAALSGGCSVDDFLSNLPNSSQQLQPIAANWEVKVIEQ